MATINTTINNGGVSSGASFSVDTDAIPALIAKYEDARDELDRIRFSMNRLEKIEPSGQDKISRASADSIKSIVSDQPGGLAHVLNEAKKHLENQIEQLRAAVNDYRGADDAATPTQS
ncbi:hypothetical protein ABZ805_04090 [Saccharopolyspora sp. NPDC047091]|uniref:hypothetical protein n=1 Tax=Saccharopolyspora sp. NPDC047091 TaxID=3155924 RepID=UPI0033D1870D